MKQILFNLSSDSNEKNFITENKSYHFFFIVLNTFKTNQPIAPPIAPEITHTKTPVIPKYNSAIFFSIIYPPTANATNTICSAMVSFLESSFIASTNIIWFRLVKKIGLKVTSDGYYREYNELNQLTIIRNVSSVVSPQLENYTYDPFGIRIKIMRNDSANTTIYTPFKELMRITSRGFYEN